MVLLVTSAFDSGGTGYGKLLAFNENGQLLGPFAEDTRVSDPRGLASTTACCFSIVARTASWRSTTRAE
jgi:hypothetical protein